VDQNEFLFVKSSRDIFSAKQSRTYFTVISVAAFHSSACWYRLLNARFKSVTQRSNRASKSLRLRFVVFLSRLYFDRDWTDLNARISSSHELARGRRSDSPRKRPNDDNARSLFSKIIAVRAVILSAVLSFANYYYYYYCCCYCARGVLRITCSTTTGYPAQRKYANCFNFWTHAAAAVIVVLRSVVREQQRGEFLACLCNCIFFFFFFFLSLFFVGYVIVGHGPVVKKNSVLDEKWRENKVIHN